MNLSKKQIGPIASAVMALVTEEDKELVREAGEVADAVVVSHVKALYGVGPGPDYSYEAKKIDGGGVGAMFAIQCIAQNVIEELEEGEE